MFQKLLIANRGEIAVRIVRTCREMGIPSVALYQPADITSLHVRLADECWPLEHPDGFFAKDEIVRLAQQAGADALHPGYGFLAERPDFIDACQQAGISVIGPPADALALIRDRVNALEIAGRAGFSTVAYAALELDDLDLDNPTHQQSVQTRAEQLGYPLVVKPGSGGNGKGERMVFTPDQLLPALRHTRAAARAAFCPRCVYLEKAIFPAHTLSALVLSDYQGHQVSLGECQAYLYPGNQKLIEETPAPCLDESQRQALHCLALDLARLFHLSGLAAFSFVVDHAGQAYFTEVKAHLPVEHPLFEMVHRIDLVREQIRIAAGLPLNLGLRRGQPTGAASTTGAACTTGAAILCRINAENPEQDFLPAPGHIFQARFPGGQEVRLDTYVYPGCDVPGLYDPLIAKLAVWDEDRPACLQRMRRALKDFKLSGISTNLSLLREKLCAGDFAGGRYAFARSTGSLGEQDCSNLEPASHPHSQDLAVIASLLHQQRLQPLLPERRPVVAAPPRRNHKPR